MSENRLTRRDFVRAAGAGVALGSVGHSELLANLASESDGKPPFRFVQFNGIHIEEPIHGAVLNRRHGQAVPGGLKIHVRGIAPADARVTVNGVAAVRAGDKFDAQVVLRDTETDIVASAAGVSAGRVRVVWDRNSFSRYRFSIDDNSFFLRDITQKQYKSLFDCFYLDILRKLNKEYGAKFVLNIYYTTGEDWKLTEFPERYKGEWEDNADWLALAFHAYANMPNRPYEDVPPEKLIADLDLVNEQIVRFAGEKVCSPPTVIHWGMTRHSAFKPLFERGVRVLSGYFRPDSQGKWDINYRWDDAHSQYLSKHDAWKDFDSGIVFAKIDIVCNSTPAEQTVPLLEPLTKDPNTAEIMDLFTHEQYFWPFYHNYIPDHAQRLDTAIRFCTEKGYKPVLYHEGFLGASG